jgi:hypothetical protein
MARIVPAKPKMSTPTGQALVTVLQGSLPDTHILFQGLGPSEAVLLMAPDQRALVIQLVEGGTELDLDGREILTNDGAIDIDALHASLTQALLPLGVVDADFSLLLSEASFPKGDVALGGAAGKGQSSATDGNGEMDLAAGTETVDTINRVLQAFAEGSSEYKPGTITAAQQRWREDLHSGAWTVGQSGPALPRTPEVTAPQDDIEWDAPSAEAGQQSEVTRPVAVRRRFEAISLNETSPRRVKYLEAMVTACVRNIAAGQPIFSSGVEIDPSFVGGPDALLPALLIAAAENWTPVVVKMGGIGGFDIRLHRDPESLLGFRVADIITSSPTVLFMPLAHAFHSTKVGEEFILDDIVGVYYRWVQKYGLENIELEEIDLKIALRVIEDG